MKDSAPQGRTVARLVAIAFLGCGGATRLPGADDAGVQAGAGSTIGAGTSVGTGTGGAAGAGGSNRLPEICTLPQVYGTCDAAFRAWWHDPATGVCVPFTYGGCDGNANNFPSLEACQERCRGGEPNMDACASANECVLVAAGCCGACDRETAFSFVSVNRGKTQDYAQQNRCSVSCGMCDPTPESERTRQYFIPGCRAGRCIVVDVRDTELVACETNDHCALRDGLECCQSCDGEGIVALNRSAQVESVTCAEPIPPCAPCAPTDSTKYQARCVDQRCTVAPFP